MGWPWEWEVVSILGQKPSESQRSSHARALLEVVSRAPLLLRATLAWPSKMALGRE